jgi:hypothetical protein
VVGRIETTQRGGEAFAVVRDLDELAKPRVQALLRRHGRGKGTELTVLSDGEDGMRTMVGTWFGRKSLHVLDWYHIARRLEKIRRGLLYLPHTEDFGDRLRCHCLALDDVKWTLWNGYLYGTDAALTWLRIGINQHTMAVSPDRWDDATYLREQLDEFRRYMYANQGSLTNYSIARGQGQRVSTAHVESTVNQVINQRMCKKQQMRWTRRGAQYLLHARTALLNGHLDRYTGLQGTAPNRPQETAA